MCQADPIDEIRSAFLTAAELSADLLRRPELADHWEDQSILAEFSVAGLAGHLLRSIKTVELYLDRPEPDVREELVSAAGYYARLEIPRDVDGPMNRSIRERGEQSAVGGPSAVAEEARSLCVRLADRLALERSDRRVAVIGDLAITLDEYLRTRIIELLVHTDDLASSLGLAGTTAPEPLAASIAIETLVSVGRLRSGDLGVLRALTRRERDVDEALRIL